MLTKVFFTISSFSVIGILIYGTHSNYHRYVEERFINFVNDTASVCLAKLENLPDSTNFTENTVAQDVSVRLTALIERRIQRSRINLKALRQRDFGQNHPATRFLTHRFTHGRLGNWLFQAASLIGIAHTNNRVASAMSSQKHRSQLFEGFHLPLMEPANLLALQNSENQDITEIGAGRYNPDTKDLNKLCRCSNKTLLLHGYLQSWKYFRDIQPSIRNMFTFRRWVFEKAKKPILDGLEEFGEPLSNVTLVGIHVRRGDHLNADMNQIGHIPATSDYLLKTTRYMEEMYYPVVFIVVTDDYMYCRNLFPADNFVVLDGNFRQPEVDMAVLTLMDRLILTVGSFGWWGAFLSDAKEVIHFRDWPRNGSALDRQLAKEDYFPPLWKAWA